MIEKFLKKKCQSQGLEIIHIIKMFLKFALHSLFAEQNKKRAGKLIPTPNSLAYWLSATGRWLNGYKGNDECLILKIQQAKSQLPKARSLLLHHHSQHFA